MAQDVDDTFILCHHRLDLRHILQTELLELLDVLTILVQDKQVTAKIHAGLHSVLEDKLGDHLSNCTLLKLEGAREVLKAE